MIVFYYGFDFANTMTFPSDTPTLLTGALTAAQTWAALVKPSFMYHNKGVGTLDASLHHPNSASSSSRGSLASAGTAGFNTQGGIWGPSSSASTLDAGGAYGAASSTTRATWETAQGHQVAFVRASMSPALTANEYWFSFDLYCPNNISTSLDSSYEATTSWKQVFRWGDVSINCKSLVYDGGAARHTMLFSIRNNGVEIATLSVPELDCDVATNTVSPTSLIYCRLRVKLDSTTGLIDFKANGVSQSVAYTNQNTVATLSNAAATEFYFGPPVLDNGTNAWVGGIDNILIDDAEFPAGRPVIRYFTAYTNPASSEAVANTGTIQNALSSFSDNAHLRFMSQYGYVTIGKAALSPLNYAPVLLGITGALIRCSNRNPLSGRHIRASLELAGVESAPGYLYRSTVFPYSTIVTPPETNGVDQLFCVFTKADNSKYALTDYNSLLVKLKAAN